MERCLKAVSIGNINVDLTFYTNEYPAKDSEVRAEWFDVSMGGSAANTAVGLSRLGIPCAMVGCVGRDEFGRMSIESLRREGVGTDWVIECDIGTGVAGVIVEGESRTMIAWRGANTNLLNALRRCRFDGTGLIHLSNVPRGVFVEAMARRGNALVSFDPGGSASEYRAEDLKGVDILLVNKAEAEEISGGMGVRILSEAAGAVVVKQGERGASLIARDKELRCDAFKTNLVDTTGAGDAFDAGFLAAVMVGKSWDEALRWGCGAGGMKVRERGARRGMPTRSELEEFLSARAGREAD